MTLNERQKRFCDEYLIDLNATRAYMMAYPQVKSSEVAKAAASRLLTDVNVATYIAERMKERQERTEVTQDMVVQELAAIGFAKATDYAEIKDGKVLIKNTDELPDVTKRAIAGIKMGRNGIELKLCDKEKALELLGRHLGMWNDKVDINLDESKSKLDDLIQQMRGDD